MNACKMGEQGGTWVVALTLLEGIASSWLELGLLSCGATLSACEKCSQWTSALSLAVGVLSEQIAANAVTHCIAISSCEKCHRWESAVALFWSAANKLLSLDVIS